MGIGYDRIHLETATECDIVVTNIPDYCIDEVSSHAIALIMVAGRRLFQIDKAVRERPINTVPPNRKTVMEVAHPIFRMRGQTVGILGLGKIGTAVALKARGLGMRVIAHDPCVLDAVMLSHGVEPVDLDGLLSQSDFISINAPRTEETTGMIGYGDFKKMKRTRYLINTARGKILDQEALIRALQEGLIAGAGLDVTEDDPIAGDNPLLRMSNVILTGHSAWYSTAADSDSEFWHKPPRQVIMALKGEWPTYAVNTEAKRAWLDRWGEKG